MTNYLHFEVRTGGITGPRIDPGQLWGCLGTSRRAYPQEWGYSSWKEPSRKVTPDDAASRQRLPADPHRHNLRARCDRRHAR